MLKETYSVAQADNFFSFLTHAVYKGFELGDLVGCLLIPFHIQFLETTVAYPDLGESLSLIENLRLCFLKISDRFFDSCLKYTAQLLHFEISPRFQNGGLSNIRSSGSFSSNKSGT